MLFQLTSAGRTLINSQALLTTITKVEFGDAFNYVPATNPTGLSGTKVYETTLNFSPVGVDANNMRFTTLIPAVVSAFTFGEVALWAGSTLIGVGASEVLIQKTTVAEYRLDIYVDLLSSQRFASWEVVSSFTRNFFPRLPSPDVLIPPAFDTNNAYVIYGDGDYNSAYLAFSDPSGHWSFSGKSRTWFNGVITSVGAFGLSGTSLTNAPANYFGTATDLVIQFTDGPQRGVCRRISTLIDGGVTWSTALLALPNVGDSFVILGPYIGSQFDGDHESLANLLGGTSGEHYHLTNSEHDRVVKPHFSSMKTVSASTYSVLDADNDAYITLTGATVTITVDDNGFTNFPVGGMVMFRYDASDVTIQVGGTNHMNPVDMIAIPVSNGTFALVRKSAGRWDYLSTVDVQEHFDGNVRHKYPIDSGSLSIPNFLPMYSPTGDEDGPLTDITSSPLAVTATGGLRIWSGSMSATPIWNAPAVILIGISGGPAPSTSTGLANNSTSYPLTGFVNGVPFSISIVGSTAQTYATFLSQFNSQLWASLGSSAIAQLSINGYGLIFETLTAGSSQSISLLNTTLFNSLVNLVPSYRITTSGGTDVVSNQSLYLNFYDSPTNNNRVYRAAFGAAVIGFQNSASGQSGFSIGGAYNFASGTYCGILGGTTNRVNGFYSQIIGGYGNAIIPNAGNSNITPAFCMVFNSNRVAISVKDGVVDPANTSTFNNINSTDTATILGQYCTVQTSRIIYATGIFTSIFGSQNVTTQGDYSSVTGSQSITVSPGTTNTNIAAGSNLTIGGSYVNVVGVRDVATAQSSANILPNGGTNAAGKPGLTLQISTSAYGSGAALALTTDAQALATTNRMIVPAGAAWFIDGLVIVNYPSGFKTWKVKASLKNTGGVTTITYIEVQDLGGTNGANMSVDLVVGAGADGDKVHFVVNSRNDVNSGYQTVSASALATVVQANALP